MKNKGNDLSDDRNYNKQNVWPLNKDITDVQNNDTCVLVPPTPKQPCLEIDIS